jgi:hypothetical protein
MKKSGKEDTFLSLVIRHNQERFKAASSSADEGRRSSRAEGDLDGRCEDTIQHINSAGDEI